MTTALEKIENKQDVIFADFQAHVKKDEESFDTIHKSFIAIRQLVSDSMDKISGRLDGIDTRIEIQGVKLQAQIDPLKADKLTQEGYNKGLADARAPNPWAIALTPILVTFILTAVLAFVAAWLAHDFLQPPGEQRSVVTSTTMVGGQHK
jgi:hypothetical protein